MCTPSIRIGTRHGSSIATALTHAVAIAALILLAACSDSDSDSSSSPTRVGASSPRVVQQGSFTLPAPTADAVYFDLATITDASSGKWEATVDWTNAGNELWMWVTNGACTADQFAREDCPFETTCPCQFGARSEMATPKPRLLTLSNASAGAHSLIIANLGPSDETASYQVTMTSMGSSARMVGAEALTTSTSAKRKTLRTR